MPAKRKKRPLRSEWPKVQQVSVRGHIRFKVDGRPHKERLFFRDKNDALVQADVWALERQNQGIEALDFPTTLRVEAIDAAGLLKPFGRSLMDAAQFYVAHLELEQRRKSSLSVQHCIAQWLTIKRAEAQRQIIAARTIRELEGRGKLFAQVFGLRSISEIEEHDVRDFLDSLHISQRSRQNVRTKLVQFFNYCVLRKWVAQNPAGAFKIRIPTSDVAILSVDETARLLEAAEEFDNSESLVPYVAVSLFAGLRPGEAEQLDWKRIHLDTKQIEVLAYTSKTRETRFVTIEPTLEKWVRKYERKTGSIIGPNFRRHWESVRAAAGFSFKGQSGRSWPADVMRHSFASYWLPINADRARLAEEMGNTIQVVKEHYKRAIPRQSAEAYWRISPG